MPRSLLWRSKRPRDSRLNKGPPSGARGASYFIDAVTVTNREKTVRINARKLTRGVIFLVYRGLSMERETGRNDLMWACE